MTFTDIDIRYYMQHDGEGHAGDLMLDFRDPRTASFFASVNRNTRLSVNPTTPARVYLKCPAVPLYVRHTKNGIELCFVNSESVRRWRKAALFAQEEELGSRLYVFFKSSWNTHDLKVKLGMITIVVRGHQKYDMGRAQGSHPTTR
jgi:hypothetical protein